MRPLLEGLEDRTVLSTITWTNPSGGSWDLGSNWSTGTVPGTNDTAVINLSAGGTVTLNQGTTESVGNITTTSNWNLSIGGDKLTVTGSTSSIAGGVSINTGSLTIQNGGTDSSTTAISVASGANFTFTGGTFAIPATSGINGAGTVNFSGGTVNDAGSYAITGSTVTQGSTANLTGSVTSLGSTTVTAGTLNVSGTGSTATASTLAFTGGTLTGSQTLTVTGATTWDGGTMSGTGTTIAQGGLTMGLSTGNSSPQDFLSQRTLDNAGAAVIQMAPSGSYTYFYLLNGAVLDSQPGSSFAFATDNTAVFSNGGTPSGGTFIDEGTLSKAGAGGAGSSSIGNGVTFNVTGTGSVAVNSSGLLIYAGGADTSTATMSTAAGANLAFYGGTFAIAASSGIAGAGTASFVGGTVNDAGSYNVTGTTLVQGGTINLNSTSSTTTLALSSGTLAGTGTLTVSGATTWDGGTMSGTGTTIAQGGLTMGLSTGNSSPQDFLSQRTLDNAGAAVIQMAPSGSYTYFYLLNGAVLDSQPGSSFAFATDNTAVFSNGGTPSGGTFIDEGTLTKAGAGGTTSSTIGSGVVFNVTTTGTVAINSSSLSIQGGGTDNSTSPITVATLSDLDFNGGTYSIAASSGIAATGSGTASFSGGTVNDAGSYNVSFGTIVRGGTANLTGSIASVGPLTLSSGTLNLSGTGSTVSTSSLAMTGGTLTGSQTLTVTGATTWDGGTMSGTGTTVAQGGLTIGYATGSSNTQDFLSQRTLDNAAAAVLQEAPSGSYTYLYMSSGGTLDSQPGSTFSFATDGTGIYSYGGTPGGGTFIDEGVLTKAGSTGSTFIGGAYGGGTVAFNVTSTGSVAVNSGTLSIQEGGTDNSTSPMTVASGADLDFNQSGYTFAIASSSGISGAGTASFSNGTVNDAGSYSVTGTTIQGGTANLSGTIASIGTTLNVPSGTLNLTGAVSPALSLTTVTLSGGTLNLSGTGSATVTTASLNQTGGTLTGTDNLTVTGATTWDGGYMSGTGTTLAQGGLTMGLGTGSSNYAIYLSQRTLDNAGAAVFEKSPGGSSTQLFISSGGTLDSQPGSTFAFATDGTYIYAYGGTPAGGTFIDEGALTKAGSTGSTVLGGVYGGGTVVFNVTSTGSVSVNGGTLSIQGGGTDNSTSPIAVASGADLDFNQSGYTFAIASSSGISGAGTASFSNGTVNDAGSYNVTGTTVQGGTANLSGTIASIGTTLNVPSGTLNLTGAVSPALSLTTVTLSGGTLNLSGTGSATVTTASLNQTGGTLTGTDNLTVTGATTWDGGYMSGTGTTLAQGGLTMGLGTGSSNYAIYLSQRTLDNAGAAVFEKSPGGSSTQLFISSGGTLDSQPGSTFAFATDGTYIYAYGGTPAGGTFIDEGALTKAGSTGSTVLGGVYGGGTVVFNVTSTGSVSVNGGTLSIQGGGTDNSTSPIAVASGADLDFNQSGYTFAIASSSGISGAGTASFSNGTVNDAGSYNVTGTTVQGGTANLSGTIASIGTTLNVPSGTLNLTGAVSPALSLTTVTLSGGTLNLSGTGSATVTTASLNQTGGTLTGTDNLTVTGATTWDGGYMSGTGTTLAQGGLTMGLGTGSSNYAIYLSQRTLDNAGAAVFEKSPGGSSTQLFISSGGTLDSQPGSTFAFATDGTYIYAYGGTPAGGTFIDEGALTKAGSTGSTVLGGVYGGGTVVFNVTSTGSVSVNGGTLSIQGGGTDNSTSPIAVASGADLDFNQSSYTFAIASSSGISGAGTASFSNGTVNDAGSYTITGGTTAQGGTANLTSSVTATGPISVTSGMLNLSGTGSTTVSTSSLAITGGTLTGSQTLTVTGATTWDGGTMSGTGTTIAQGGLTMGYATGSSNTQDFLTQRTLDNAGVGVIQTAPSGNYTYLYLASGAILDNQPGASFAFANDNNVVVSNGGSPNGGTFIDEGTLTKAGSSGGSQIGANVVFNVTSTGSVSVVSGYLTIQGGGTDNSPTSISVAAGADLDLYNGTFAIAASSGISGAGTASFSGGTVTDAGSYNVATTLIRGGEIDFNAAASTTTLTESSGTLAGTGTLTVSSLTTWTGGSMSGTGKTAAQGVLTVGGTAATNYYEYLAGRELDNYGVGTINAYTPYGNGFYFSNGATLDNESGASLGIGTDTGIYANGGTPSGGTLVNQGLLSKTGGTATSAISVSITDTGTITASVATLSLQGGGTISGSSTLSASPGATLNFAAGSYTEPSGSSIVGTGTGTVSFTGATVTVNGTYSVAGTTYVSSGEVDFNAAASTAALTEAGGTVGGSATLTVSGLTTWTGGSMSGTGKTAAQGGLTVGGTAATNYYEYLAGRELDNYGVGTINAYTPYGNGFYFSNGATLDNESGASLGIGTDTGIYANGGTPSGGTLVNQGLLSKTGGTATSAISVSITDTGTITASVATLSLQGGGTISGSSTLSASPGATLNFAAGTYTEPSGSSIVGTGTGTVSFTGATVTVNGTYSVAGTTYVSAGEVDFNAAASTAALTEAGGTVGGSATLTVSGLTTWTGGSMSGTGKTAAQGGLTVGGTATTNYYEYLAGRELDNYGVGTINAYTPYGNGFYFSNGATLDNESGASLGIGTDTGIYANGGTPSGGTLVNQGLLSKTGGTGTSIISVALNNTGVIQASSGTLSIQGTFSNFSSTTNTLTGGSYIVAATLQFTSANIVTNAASITLTGTSSKIIDTSSNNALRNFATNAVAGSFSLLGGQNFTTPGAFTDAGSLSVGSGSTFTSTGAFTQSGGFLGGTGKVAGNVNNTGGQVTPGGVGTAGALTIQGVYTQGSGGSLDIELGGTAAGVSYDELVVTGSASLGGTINISTLNGFVPALGNSFQVLTFASKTGDFQTYNGLYVSGQIGLTPSYSPSNAPVALALTTSNVVNNWVNNASGDWDTASNWTYGVPVAGQTVEISYPGITVTHTSSAVEPALASLDDFATLNLSNGSITVSGPTTIETNSNPGDLILDGGTFTTNGALNVYGHLDWSSGSLNGSGTATIGNTGVANLSSGTLTIGTSTLTSSGTINFSSGTLSGILSSSGQFNWTGGYLGGTLTSSGSMAISGSSNKYIIGSLTNAGTLTWTGGGTIGGYATGATLTNQAGATFAIQTDNTITVYAGSLSFANAGTITKSVTSGTTTIAVPFTDTGTVNVQTGTFSPQGGGTTTSATINVQPGATYDLTGGGASTYAGTTTGIGGGSVLLEGGTLATVAGGATFNFAAGMLQWTGGTISGTLTSAGTLMISGSGSKYLAGSLTNAGTLTWTGGAIDSYATGATLTNQAGATFAIQVDNTIAVYTGTLAFANAGTITKSTTSGTTSIQVPFTNTGTVNAQTGTISLQGGGSGGGTFAASSGAVVSVDSGTYTLNAGSGFSGSGTFQVNGGTLAVATGANPTLANLTLASGTTAGPGSLSVGQLTWTGGFLGGTVTATGAGTISVGGSKYLAGSLTNAGTLTWTGGAIDSYATGATLTNQAGATFAIQVDNTIGVYTGTLAFANAGTITKSVTSGTTTIAVPFTDTGTVNVQTGTISLQGGGSGGGTFTASSGAVVSVDSGTYTLNAGSGFSGSGTFQVNGGTLAVATGANPTLANLTLASGTTAGPGSLSVGQLTWTGGFLGGTVTATGAGTISVGGSKYLAGSLTNAGTLTWTGGAIDSYATGATLTNQAGATFAIQVDNTIAVYTGTLAFANAGTITKSVTSGTTTIAVPFTDTGTVNVQTGTISLQGGGSGGGTFAASSGAVVSVDSGTYTLNAGSGFSGSGTFQVNGGTLAVASGATPTLVNLTLASGTTAGPGSLSVGQLTWTGGFLGGTVTATGAGTISVGGSKYLAGSLTNAGTLTWTAGPIYGNATGAKLTNQAGATFAIQTDNTIAVYAGSLVFTNAGTLTKSATSGTTTIGIPFTNTGTVNVQSGTVDLTGGFSNFSGSTLTGGTYFVQGTGEFEFIGANIVTNAATIILDGTSSEIINTSSGNALAGFATNAAAGHFTVQDGATFTTVGALSNVGAVTVSAGSSLTVAGAYTQTGGSTTVLGTLSSGANPISISGGTLAGSGTVVGNVTNSGIVSPGVAGPGILSITGNYTQTTSGALNVDLGGTTAGSQSDQLAVSGTASLNGTLNVDFINSYVPNTGDSIAILAYNTDSGKFANVNGATFGNNQALYASYLSGQLDLVNSTAGVSISPTSGLVTTQAGGTATFQVVLQTQPTASVTVPIASSNTNQGAVSTSSLVFTPSNWNVPQTVTVTGVNNNDVAPSVAYSILTGPAVSSDPNYNGQTSSAVAVTNVQTNTRDLQVTNLAVNPPTGLQSGQALTVNWNDTDSGNVGVNASFVDQVMIVNETTGVTLVTATVPYNETTSGPIAANGSIARQYSFTLPNYTAGAGQIEFFVTTNSNNQVYERNNNGTAQSNNTSSLTETAALAAADLQVTGLSFTPSSGLQSGNVLTVGWDDSNTGSVAVTGSFTDSITLKNLTTGVALGTQYITYTESSSGPIAAGGFAARSANFTLPDGTSGVGTIQATVVTDYTDVIPEYNSSGTGYTNNTSTATTTSTLANYADLQVASLAVTPSTGLQSGNTATATWDDNNTGDGAVGASFTDSVTVVNTTTNQTIASGYVTYNEATSGPIAAGQEAAEQFSFKLPDGSAGVGSLKVTVTTDYGQSVKEYNASGNTAYGNNTANSSVTSTLANYADLVVATNSIIVTPASPQSSGQATVTWMDANQGDGAASGSSYDQILVQRLNADNSLTTIASGTVAGPSTLAAGANGPKESFAFTLPDGVGGVGNFKVTVTVDYYDSIKEYDANGNTAYSNNSSSSSLASTLANYADLIVAANSLAVTPGSPQSGGQATVTWMDQNQGDAAVNVAFTDSILVQRVVGSTLTTIASGTVNGNPTLAAGATSGVESFAFTLPNGTSGTGDFRVTVTTDSGQTVKEYDPNGNPAYANNATSTDVTATLAPSSDLVVQSIVANGGVSGPVLPGQTIAVTWKDVNQGTIAANGTWLDQVFLSSDSGGTQNLQLLQTVQVSANLTPTGSMAESTTITVPATDVGNKYVVVETGLSESFFELNTSNNTSVTTSPITIPPSVTVSLAAPGNSTFNKNTVNPATTATVTRNDTSAGALSVTITSANPSAVLLSASPGATPAASISVVIPNGSFSAVFYVDAVQDGVVDGSQTSSLTPTAPGYLAIPATATELETNRPTFTLTLAANSFADGAGTTATLTRNVNATNPLDAAVTVAIASSDPSVATAPATVTIPAGQNSVSFPIAAVATSLLVATRSVTFTTNSPIDPVTGLAFAASAATATVTDLNTPTLVLTTDAPVVEENASNPATYATLTLTDGHGNPFPLASAITVDLNSNDPADLTLPSSVLVPAGTVSIRIPLTAIDNPSNANPIVTLTAYALDAITSYPIAMGHASTTISVLSTNGSSLSLAGPAFISVAEGQGMATVSRGANDAFALVVTLTSSNTGEATVPATITIAAGSPSASFEVQVAGGAVAGPVTISASASGLNSAALTTTIVTASLPDLAVVSVTPPSSPLSGQTNVPVTWLVTNDGNVAAGGSWVDRVTLSTDPAGNNVISTQYVTHVGGLAVGSTYSGTANFNLPTQAGSYYVTVTTDQGSGTPAEITASNDSMVAGFNLGSAYYAVLNVQSNEKQVAVGSPVTVAGTLLNASGVGNPVGGILELAVYRDGKSVEEVGADLRQPERHVLLHVRGVRQLFCRPVPGRGRLRVLRPRQRPLDQPGSDPVDGLILGPGFDGHAQSGRNEPRPGRAARRHGHAH